MDAGPWCYKWDGLDLWMRYGAPWGAEKQTWDRRQIFRPIPLNSLWSDPSPYVDADYGDHDDEDGALPHQAVHLPRRLHVLRSEENLTRKTENHQFRENTHLYDFIWFYLPIKTSLRLICFGLLLLLPSAIERRVAGTRLWPNLIHCWNKDDQIQIYRSSSWHQPTNKETKSKHQSWDQTVPKAKHKETKSKHLKERFGGRCPSLLHVLTWSI